MSFRSIVEGFKKNRTVVLALLTLVLLSLFWIAQPRKAQKTGKMNYPDRIPVSVALVSKAAVRDTLSFVGSVEGFREAEIFSETGGLVRKVQAEPGERKAAGTALFVIDDELSSAEQRRSEARYRQAERNFGRYKTLYREGAVSLAQFESAQLQYQEAEAEWLVASRKLRNATIKAPFSGVVTSRFVEQGEVVRDGLKVAHMADMTKVKIVIYLPEQQVMKLPSGTPVTVTSDLYPAEHFTGRVGSVSDKAGRDHTYRVEVMLQNPGKAVLRSGMFARVIYSGRGDREAVFVPRSALVSGIRTPEVYVVHHGQVSLRRFVAGMEHNKQLEVLGGLAPGDSVVISGQNELQEGSMVSVITGKRSLGTP